jgi:hypothetical protein
MPGTTAVFGLRYQVAADSPEGDDLGKNLADDTEAALLAERQTAMCQLVQQTAQTGWTSGTSTAVTFGASSETVDTGTFHDTGSNTSRIVIGKKLGWWQVGGVYAPATNTASSYIRASIGFNGSVVAGSTGGILISGAAGFVAVSSGNILVQAVSATDYVELLGYQIAGSGTVGTGISAPLIVSSLTAVWKRPS